MVGEGCDAGRWSGGCLLSSVGGTGPGRLCPRRGCYSDLFADIVAPAGGAEGGDAGEGERREGKLGGEGEGRKRGREGRQEGGRGQAAEAPMGKAAEAPMGKAADAPMGRGRGRADGPARRPTHQSGLIRPGRRSGATPWFGSRTTGGGEGVRSTRRLLPSEELGAQRAAVILRRGSGDSTSSPRCVRPGHGTACPPESSASAEVSLVRRIRLPGTVARLHEDSLSVCCGREFSRLPSHPPPSGGNGQPPCGNCQRSVTRRRARLMSGRPDRIPTCQS
jgi:hypothetical protein